MMHALWRSTIYGIRTLSRSPGFTVTVVICLALGIGTNAAIFSIVNAVLLRQLPCKEPSRLVYFYEKESIGDLKAPSGPSLTGCKERTQTLEDMAAYGYSNPVLAWSGGSEMIFGLTGTVNLLRVLGISPVLGRDFLPDEDSPEKSRVAMLGYTMWLRRFGADRNVLGKTVILDGQPHTVIAVLPDSINFLMEPNNVFSGKADVMVPLRVEKEVEEHWMSAVARIRKGVTLKTANADVDALMRQLSREKGASTADTVGGILVGVSEKLTRNARPVLMCLQGAGFFVFLIACVNVANLFLMRNVAREKDIAVRVALGAGRFRILRELMMESLTLSLIGGAVGVLIALWEVDLFLQVSPGDVARLREARVDVPVLGFALVLSVLSALMCGIIQGLRAFKGNIVNVLATGARTPALGRRQHRILSASIVVEVSLTLALLTGAGLMLNSFWRLSRIDPGFNPRNLLTAAVMLSSEKYRDEEASCAAVDALLQRLDSVPRVLTAGASSTLPMTGSEVCNVAVEGREEAGFITANIQRITDGYFRAMGTTVLEGEPFAKGMAARSRGKTIVNRTLAAKFFGSENPLGKRLRLRGLKCRYAEIVGVVSDVRVVGLQAEATPTAYVPFYSEPSPVLMLAVRTSGNPMDVAEDVRRAVWAGDSSMPVMMVRPMTDIVSRTISRQRFTLFLLVSFAGTALLLATFGVYGLSSYAVSRRTHEMGIRMALGAQPRDVLFMVLRQGLALTVAGLAIGLAASLALSRYMAGMLYEIAPNDPATLIGAAVLLTLVALPACYFPARRATRVDPVVAIRCE